MIMKKMTREDLHEELAKILGSRNVYFQPPESVKIKYPCIIYERSNIIDTKANNESYITHKQYTIMVLDKDPESEIPDKIQKLPYCRFDRHYVSENINHDVFTLYL